MDAILQTAFLNSFSYITLVIYQFKFRCNWFPMAWCQAGDKSLSEPVLAGFTDTCKHHSALTHCGLVTSYGGRDLGQHWLK